jgi:hypothetical protein
MAKTLVIVPAFLSSAKPERMHPLMPTRANVKDLQRVLFARVGMGAFCVEVLAQP